MSLGLLVLLGVLASAPASYAIPSAGDYMFTAGLTGTFHSDGTKLTTWDITDLVGYRWLYSNPVQFVEANNTTYISVKDPADLGSTVGAIQHALAVYWDTSEASQFTSTRLASGFRDFPFYHNGPVAWQPTSVPEPATVVLLTSGLMGLAGYEWRKRRQAGQQVE